MYSTTSMPSIFLSMLLACVLVLACPLSATSAQTTPTGKYPDLPNPPQNSFNISAGALIIPMDDLLQVGLTTSLFNLRAYGLVINLLHADVPVLWAIRSGKTKDGIDFWARTTPISLPVGLEVHALNITLNQLLGLVTSAIPLPFFAGPFIVERQFTEKALQVAYNFTVASRVNLVNILSPLTNLTNTLGALTSTLTGVTSGLTSTLGDVTSGVGNVVGTVTGDLGNVVGSTVSSTVGSVVGGVSSTVGSVVGGASSTLGGLLKREQDLSEEGGHGMRPQLGKRDLLDILNVAGSGVDDLLSLIVSDPGVNLFLLQENITVDIGHVLLHKPKVLVSTAGDSQNTHTDVLNAAGLVLGTHYFTTASPSDLASIADVQCYSIITQPHYEWEPVNTASYYSTIKTFVQNGGNFLAQSAAIDSFENPTGNSSYGGFLTRGGITKKNLVNPLLEYPNSDLPFSQFFGPLDGLDLNTPDTLVTDLVSGLLLGGGTRIYDFYINNPPGEAVSGYVTDDQQTGWWNNSGHSHVYNVELVSDLLTEPPNGRSLHIAASAKLTADLLGGLVFYLGGYEWSSLTPLDVNGRRMYLNAVVSPPNISASCGLSFCPEGYKCDPLPCHTCTCQGGVPVQTPIPSCCLADSDCGSPCQVCSAGQCIAGNDNATCGDCGMCSAGVCASDPSEASVCGDCNTCSAGYCTANDTLTCGDCRKCSAGSCVADATREDDSCHDCGVCSVGECVAVADTTICGECQECSVTGFCAARPPEGSDPYAKCGLCGVCASNGQCFEACDPDDFGTNTTCSENSTVPIKTEAISGGAVAGAVVGAVAGAGGAAALGALAAAGAMALARHWNSTPEPGTGASGLTASTADSVFDSPLHQAATSTGSNPLWTTEP